MEAQQAEAAEAATAPKPRLTRQEAARLREREGLHLSRQRILEQLNSNPNPRHAEMLAAALHDVEAKLALLNRPPD